MDGGTVPTTYSPWVSTPFLPFLCDHRIRRATPIRIVLSDVGCNQPLVDDHDVRILWETLSGTYTYVGSVSGKKGWPDNQADVGGWENYPALTRPANWDSDHDGLPDWWEEMIGTNANSAASDFSDSNSDPDGDGYTALEDYLNWMADPHAAASSIAPANLDLSRYAAGFTNATFTVASPTHGTVSLLANGRTAQFTPAANYLGRAGFNFTVSGSGTSITRSAGLVVAPALSAFTKAWKGGVAGNAWDFSTVNWLQSSTPEFFQNGNPALFDDSGVPNTSVTLTGLLLPSSVTVSGTANYTFGGTGSLSGAMSLLKAGNGKLTITGTHTFSGDTTVQGGTLVLNGALNGSKLIVQSGAVLSGSGALAGLVIDSGGMVTLNSSPLTVQGSATNNGTLRATGQTRLLVSGTFLNNGVLDVLSAPGALPASLVNGPNGVVIDSTDLQVMDAAKSDQTFTITIHTFAGYGYQLQKSSSLLNPTWQNVAGQFRNGNGSDWTFTDANSIGGQLFYRVLVTTQ